MIDFFKVYGLEVFGTIASIVYLYYSIREKVWCWPWGIVASISSILVFFMARLYADMGLQFYYVFVSLYGWYYWLRGNETSDGKKPVGISKTSFKQGIALVITGMLTYVVILYLLLHVPQWLEIEKSAMPYLDALTTAASIMATWMLARKLIDHWIIWVAVDVLSMGMYVCKGLYFYAFLFLIYTVGAILGYMEWKKHMIDKKEMP